MDARPDQQPLQRQAVDVSKILNDCVEMLGAEIKAREKAAEYGKWRNWYRGEWLVGIDETSDTCRTELWLPLWRTCIAPVRVGKTAGAFSKYEAVPQAARCGTTESITETICYQPASD